MALKLTLRLKNQEISQGMFTVLKIYLLINITFFSYNSEQNILHINTQMYPKSQL